MELKIYTKKELQVRTYVLRFLIQEYILTRILTDELLTFMIVLRATKERMMTVPTEPMFVESSVVPEGKVMGFIRELHLIAHFFQSKFLIKTDMAATRL